MKWIWQLNGKLKLVKSCIKALLLLLYKGGMREAFEKVSCSGSSPSLAVFCCSQNNPRLFSRLFQLSNNRLAVPNLGGRGRAKGPRWQADV